MTDKETMKLALEAAYLAGFNASGEGYNGEYGIDCPEENAIWKKDRDNELTAIKQALAQQEPLEYWNAVEGWVKIDEVREHFDSVGCGTIYKTSGDGRVPLTAAQQGLLKWTMPQGWWIVESTPSALNMWPANEDILLGAALAQPAPDYAWPTVADYEKDVGFEVNEAFTMAWAMARTTNSLFT